MDYTKTHKCSNMASPVTKVGINCNNAVYKSSVSTFFDYVKIKLIFALRRPKFENCLSDKYILQCRYRSKLLRSKEIFITGSIC
jgi:hypothetical protein